MRSKHWYMLPRLIMFSAMLSISIFTGHMVQAFVQRYMSSMKLRRRDHDGIGLPYNEACANSINIFLSDTSEFNKGGYAAGTTLMTLLPTLLSFAPLPTAKIRDSMYTSPWLALLTAGLTFGLPVTQYSTLPDQRTFKADELFPHQNNELGSVAPADGAEQFNRAAVRAKIFQSTNQRSLIRLIFTISGVGFLQWALFLLSIDALPNIELFTVIWACKDSSVLFYVGWLTATYGLSSVFLLYWNSSFRKAQIVLHCIPEEQCTFKLETRGSKNISSTRGLTGFLRMLYRAVTDLSAMKLIKMAGLMSSLGSDGEIFQLPCPSIVIVRVADLSQQEHFWAKYLASAARAGMLLLLTLLFGSLWGYRLFRAFASVLVFSVIIFLSRAISIWSSTWLQNYTNLTIIECDDVPTIDRVEQKLLSIRGILINNKTSGCSYLNNQPVGPKGSKAGGAIISCFILSYLNYCILVGLTLLGAIFSTAPPPIAIITSVMQWAMVLLFHNELKHKAGFNIPEQLLDEPVEIEVRAEELAEFPQLETVEV